MSLEQRDTIEETSHPVITRESASAAIGDLPSFGSAKKMGVVNERRQFFAEFMQKHSSGLMALLKTAEDFAVNEVAPLVERDMKNAALGQVEHLNDRTEESEPDIMDQDSGKPSQKTVN